MTRQIVVNGYTYNVEGSMTPEDMEAKGLVNVAKLMRSNGQLEQMTCRKPNGKKVWMFIRYQFRGEDFYKQVNSRGW